MSARLSRQQKTFIDAVRLGQSLKVKLYLDKGCDPNVGRDGQPPLHDAVISRNLQIVRMLVKAGADVHAQNDRGMTAYDIAISWKYQPIADYLEDCMSDNATRRMFAKKPQLVRDKYTQDTLKDIFNAEKWAGRADDMCKAWDEVPAHLRRDFDFSAQLAEVRRQSLHTRRKGRIFAPKNPG